MFSFQTIKNNKSLIRDTIKNKRKIGEKLSQNFTFFFLVDFRAKVNRLKSIFGLHIVGWKM
jgi:hypothetical protein